jgi:alpha-D-ribose 1-methylphosphonate 5-triphosphate synthase subunit PhnH
MPGIGRPRVSVTVIATPERDDGAGAGAAAGRRGVGAACAAACVAVCANDATAIKTPKLKQNTVETRIRQLCPYRFVTAPV